MAILLRITVLLCMRVIHVKDKVGLRMNCVCKWVKSFMGLEFGAILCYVKIVGIDSYCTYTLCATNFALVKGMLKTIY